jgi:putative restriction endonuclease
MTTVDSPLDVNPTGLTILLGYEPSRKAFAGFDLSRHRLFTIGSPSIQIDIRTLDQSLQDGLAFYRKSNSEIAVGARPDQLMAYAQNAQNLHTYGRQADTLGLLQKASSLQEISEQDIAFLNAQRKRIIQTVSRLSRQANFRQQVLHAYGNRCAVTRMQLRLVDAAHILPVGAPGSADDIRNGIALSPTYHRAFDNGLIYLDESHTMRVNPERESSLAALRLDGGLSGFKVALGRVLLPPDRRQWPHATFIKNANRFRKVRES